MTFFSHKLGAVACSKGGQIKAIEGAAMKGISRYLLCGVDTMKIMGLVTQQIAHAVEWACIFKEKQQPLKMHSKRQNEVGEAEYSTANC